MSHFIELKLNINMINIQMGGSKFISKFSGPIFDFLFLCFFSQTY